MTKQQTIVKLKRENKALRIWVTKLKSDCINKQYLIRHLRHQLTAIRNRIDTIIIIKHPYTSTYNHIKTTTQLKCERKRRNKK